MERNPEGESDSKQLPRRRQARERALQALYQMDSTGVLPDEALASFAPSTGEKDDPAVLAYAKILVHGVAEHLEMIDEVIQAHSSNWRIGRMAKVDRNVLRVATFELIHRQDVPHKVVINEAIEVAKRFGTEESGAFINGILDTVARDVRTAEGEE